MTTASVSQEDDTGTIDALLAELEQSETVRAILDVVCQATNMGFAAVAHVTQDRWVAAQVRDDIAFGLTAGGELPIKSTLCDTVRGTRDAIVIDEVAADPIYRDHHTPATYGLQSYIAYPIILESGEIFGTLCAIDPTPKQLDTPQTRGMFRLFAQLIGTHIERLRLTARGREYLQQNSMLEARVAEVLDEAKVYADIVDSSNAAVTALGLDGRILAINRANVEAFERVYGKRPIVGQRFLDLFEEHSEYREQQEKIWKRALSGETFFIIEAFGDAAIEQRHYEVRFTPLLDRAGNRIGASSTSYDVTDRVEAEQQLASAREQLLQSQKVEAMGQLTGGVAHDFNNLLTPIVGSLDILERSKFGTEREQRLIAGAAQSAERARVLVQRLLAFARRQPLQAQPVDVGGLAQGMAELLASTLGPQISLAINVADDLQPAHADPNQLEMAILNLSVNARDAMPDGGTLQITVSQERRGWSNEDGLPAHDYIRVTVGDDGAGMDDDTIARATEPFFSTKGIGKGTGLGLSMVDGLARQLGGVMLIKSAVGQGTQVHLLLPVSALKPVVPEEASAIDKEPSPKGLVLLVEDEFLVRMSTADMLEQLGYEVIEAETADEALRKLSSGLRPDVVVTDHLMPGMTGVDLVRAMANEVPGVPTLLVSGYADVDGIDAGIARLTKPFVTAELGASLAALLP